MNEARADVGASQSSMGRLKGAAPFGAAALAVVAGLVAASLTVNTAPAPAPQLDGTLQQTPAAGSPAANVEPAFAPPPAGPSLPGVANDQAPGAARPAMGVEIVVKFKDDAKIKDMLDGFWRDPVAAKKRFEEFKAGQSEFAGLKLDRVTYSNELVLVDSEGGGEARLAAMRSIAARLQGHPDISYAEPNLTAQPGVKPQ